jgi:hypothetical protein
MCKNSRRGAEKQGEVMLSALRLCVDRFAAPARGGVSGYPGFHLHLLPRQVSLGVRWCEDAN